MSLQDQPPKLLNGNWVQWAMRISSWLASTRSTLRYKLTGESAVNDGVMLWDSNGYPIVSYNNEFVGIVLANGFTVAALPTGTIGQRAYVTDASSPTFGSPVSGGGAVVIPVFKNASAWIVG